MRDIRNQRNSLGLLASICFLISAVGVTATAYPPDWAKGKADPACTTKDICPHVNEKSGNRQRPPVSYTSKLKRQEIAEHPEVDCSVQNGGCELDHVIPIALCGATKDPANIAIEPALPHPGYHEKDWVEEALHKAVCNDVMDLPTAQDTVKNYWEQYYRTYHRQDDISDNP